MKVAMVRQQLRWSDVLNGDRIMRGIRSDGTAVSFIVGGHKSGDVRKNGLADLHCFGGGVESRQCGLAEIRREDESIVLPRREGGRSAIFGDLDGGIATVRRRLAG